MHDGDETQPSTRRADLDSSKGSGGLKAGEGEQQQQRQHPGLKHATSWRDNLSFSNPKLWIFFGIMFAMGITVSFRPEHNLSSPLPSPLLSSSSPLLSVAPLHNNQYRSCYSARRSIEEISCREGGMERGRERGGVEWMDGWMG